MKTLSNVHATGSQSKFQPRIADPSGVRNAMVILTAGVLCLFSASALRAAASPEDDAPANTQKAMDATAARLSSVDGQVRVIQDGQIIADPATANLPLFEGSQVITGNDGRAEVQLEGGNLARLSPNTTLTFTVMKHEGTSVNTEVVVNSGLAYFELQPSSAEHSLRVSYGPASFVASSFSVVRIRLDTPPGDLAVFSGNVRLERGDALQLDIHGGESLSLEASDISRYNLAETIDPDSWDSWNADRDQVLNGQAGERTAATVSLSNSGNVGMSDLDANGNWYDVPGQGYVWSPYDAQGQGAGWDPYGYGQWVSYPSYGYVWASGYGWGYAPYQCGLWNYYDNFGWGWAPGMGCNPWWGAGGWGYNIGNSPRGYRPPRRPLPGPGRGGPRPVGGSSHGLRVASVIPVDRRAAGSANMAAYARPVQPVVIGGHTVEPLRPVAPRQGYDRPAGTFAARSGAVYNGSGAHSVYSPGSTYSTYHPAQPSGSRPATQSYASHSQSAPASHQSYSGGGGSMGGGGASHSSGGGGGGGGGGGTHK